jgi:hypothetical protein
MAWTHTNSYAPGEFFTNPFTITLGFTPTTGRLLIVTCMVSIGTTGITSITGAGVVGGFSKAIEQLSVASNNSTSMWYGVVGGSPTTSVVVTPSTGTPGVRVITDEWSGNNTNQAAVLENTASNDNQNITLTTITVGPVTVTNGNLLMTATSFGGAVSAVSAGTSPAFTMLESVTYIYNAYRIAAEGSDSSVWTWTTAAPTTSVLAGFNLLPSGGYLGWPSNTAGPSSAI